MIATYGHGTENDFVLVFDPTDEHSITTAQTAAICNRETGIGADGLIRMIKRDGKWFMDYRNADGSLAEMCGNGIRVMARYLVERGHQPEGIFAINTRDGIKHLRVPLTDDISVNMGQVTDEAESITLALTGISGMATISALVIRTQLSLLMTCPTLVNSKNHQLFVREILIQKASMLSL